MQDSWCTFELSNGNIRDVARFFAIPLAINLPIFSSTTARLRPYFSMLRQAGLHRMLGIKGG